MSRRNNIDLVIRAKDTASATVNRLGGSLKTLGAIAGITGGVIIGQKLVQGLGNAIRTAADFESGMSRVKAISSATGTQMEKLTGQAKTLGRTTVFAATQAAEGQAALAKAGFQVNEILGALPGTLDLAAAGELELGEASSITATLIRSFGLEASQAVDVADLLAKAANSANTTVSELGQQFSFVAPSAKALGIGITETTAALQVLADSGMGQRSGRALSTALVGIVRMAKSGEGAIGALADQLLKADGTSVGFAQTLRVLRDNNIDAIDALSEFDAVAGRAMNILIRKGPEALDEKFAKLMDRAGFAAQVAAEKLNNLKGDTIKYSSAVEGLQIAFTEKGTPALRAFVQSVTEVVLKLTDAIETSPEFAEAIQSAILVAVKAVRWLVRGVQALIVGWNLLNSGFNTVVAALVDGFQMIVNAWQLLVKAVNVGGFLDGIAGALDTANQTLQDMIDGLDHQAKTYADAAASAVTSGNELADSLGKIEDAVTKAGGANADAAEKIEETAAAEDMVTDALVRLQEEGEAAQEFLAGMTDAYENIGNAAEAAAAKAQHLQDLASGGDTEESEDKKQQDQETLDEMIEAALFQADAELARGRALEESAKKQDRMQRVMKAGTTIATSFARAFAQNFAAVVSGSKSAGEAIKSLAAAVLNSLAQQALGEAAMQIAKGFAALAAAFIPGQQQMAGAAALHFKSAALFGIMGAVAGAAAGAVGGKKQAGGLITGTGGTDSQIIATTPGEGVLTTSETQAVLSGRAAIVPMGGSGSEDEDDAERSSAGMFDGLRGTILDGDAVADFFERNTAALGHGIRFAQVRGEL